MPTAKDWKGIWLISGIIVVLAFFFAVKVSVGSRPTPGTDNCVGTSVASTVILFDRSEEISAQTLDEIEARALAHIRDHVQLNERVTLFNVTDLSKRSLKPIVSLCRPPDSGSRLTENPRLIQKQYEERFIAPIKLALNTLPGSTPESPIAQAVTDVSLSVYLKAQSNSLLIFSDMLENSSAFSLYRCASAADVIARYRESRRGAKERPAFHSTKVYLNLIPRLRQTAETLKCRDTLWTWFFGDNDGPGAGLEMNYLPGGEPLKDPAKGTSR